MNLKRRNFIGSAGIILLAGITRDGWSQVLSEKEGNITSVTLYLVNVTKARNFSHSTWENRQHVFISVKSGGFTGWAESLAYKNDLAFDIKKWGSFFNEIKGLTVDKAIDYCSDQFMNNRWQHRMSEPALMALYDLKGRLHAKPTIELLDLDNRTPVPGLFCILEKDVKKALEQAEIAKKQNLTSHVKVKFFGIKEVDMSLTTSLRKFFGPNTYLTADANRGYKNWESIDELAGDMRALNLAGLDAIEDPATLTTEQWIELQTKVGDLALIPDYPMRPAYKALKEFTPAMGKIFNIHPDTMGTFVETISLGKTIKEHDKKLMIGDSSFVGPACTFWQQLAIGLGASWVEALEKPQESSVFQQCVKRKSTTLNSLGRVEIKKLYPGFGLEMDDAKLEKMADKTVHLY
jgi:L-alanine-DL-glutamate epimerase-like enolase superfamily enzyme